MQSLWDMIRHQTRRSVIAGAMEGFEALSGSTAADGREVADEIIAEEDRERAEIETEQVRTGSARIEQAKSIEAKGPTIAERAVGYVMQQETHPLDPFEQRLRDSLPENQEPFLGVPPKKRGRPRKNPEP